MLMLDSKAPSCLRSSGLFHQSANAGRASSACVSGLLLMAAAAIIVTSSHSVLWISSLHFHDAAAHRRQVVDHQVSVIVYAVDVIAARVADGLYAVRVVV
jgi:hypothetical protein